MNLRDLKQFQPELNTQELSRKDKRRQNIESKVIKIARSFIVDEDNQYRGRLKDLQTTLNSLHQGTSLAFVRALRDLEEERDLELVRLRLYEEYRIQRSITEFQDDIERTKEEHERMIKLCKEKFYESFEKRIKKIKEDRLLMDVANAHSYVMDYSRSRVQNNTRNLAQTTWDSSASEVGTGACGASANESGAEAGPERRTLRRRISNNTAARVINEECEYTSAKESSAAQGAGRTSSSGVLVDNSSLVGSQHDSDSEFLQYISDSNELYALLFGSGEKDPEKKKTKNNQRISTKTAPPLYSLTPEEVTEDIVLIRQLTSQPPTPFKI